MGFYAGQKVVCINVKGVSGLLKLNAVYIIEKGNHIIPGISGVFVAIVGVYDSLQYNGFFPSRFRPLVSTKTDISIFTAMLGPKAKDRIDA